MPHLQIIVASTREGRKGRAVADWTEAQARAHAKFEVELVDLADVNLPMFDEPEHPRLRRYHHEHTRAWSASVDRADAFVLVTPEYNFSPAPALVNALDYVLQEWAYKPAAFVSYGGVSGGLRGVQVTKLQMSALKMVPIVEAVSVPFFTRFIDKDTGEFRPEPVQAEAARLMLDELFRWTEALKVLRDR